MRFPRKIIIEPQEDPNDIMGLAAKNNHMDCVIYLQLHGFPVKASTLVSAVHSNNIEIIRYIYQYLERDSGYKYISLTASRSQNIALLHFVFAECDGYKGIELMDIAAQDNNLDAVKALHESFFIDIDVEVIIHAAKNDAYEIITYLRSKICPWDDAVLYEVCKQDKYDMFAFLLNLNCPVIIYYNMSKIII